MSSSSRLRRLATCPPRRDDENRAISPVNDRARDRAKQRSRDRAKTPRSDDDQVGVSGTSKVDGLVWWMPLKNFLVRVTLLLAGEPVCAVEGVSSVGRLLTQLLLRVRLPRGPIGSRT